MSELKRKIRRLEVEIDADRRSIKQHKALLTEKIASPQFLTCAIVGGFALGFLFEHQHMREKLKGSLNKAPGVIKGFYSILRILY